MTSTIMIALFACSCVGSEVTYIGAKYPAKPEGCDVKIFPSTTPDYKWADIATVESHCHFTQGRTACIDELKKSVCKAGGDTLYGFKDGRQGEAFIVIGTVGRRTGDEEIEKAGGEAPKTASEPAALPKDAKSAAGGCEPPCSPGYRCEANQCLALCNPACGEGMRCNQQRICESVAALPAETPPSK
jgi:hypothetical protein